MRVPTTAPCPACTDTEVDDVLEGRESMFGSGERFRYLQCSRCTTLRLDEPPADLSPYYPQDYYSVADDPEVAMGRGAARLVVRLLGRSALTGRGWLSGAAARLAPVRQVRTLMSLYGSVARCPLPRGRQPRVLDVGAGSGALVYGLSLAGFEAAVGIDPFAAGDRVFDTGARLLACPLEGMDDKGWDLVMFHHSFEHLSDPESALRAAIDRLAPGGSILIRMPTVSSWAREHYAADWAQLDPPRHLVLFSREGMRLLAERCGLLVLSVVDDSTGFQFWGSEQLRRGLPLMAPDSHMVNPRRSPFGALELARWGRRSRRLNAEGRGDQACWVLQRRDAPDPVEVVVGRPAA